MCIFYILPDTYKVCSQPEGNLMLRGIGYMKCQPWMMWIFVNCAIHSLWVYLLFLSQIIQVCIIIFGVCNIHVLIRKYLPCSWKLLKFLRLCLFKEDKYHGSAKINHVVALKLSNLLKISYLTYLQISPQIENP